MHRLAQVILVFLCFVFCAAAESSQSPDAAPGSFGGATNDGAVGEKGARRPG
jgi:hypothetical protein